MGLILPESREKTSYGFPEGGNERVRSTVVVTSRSVVVLTMVFLMTAGSLISSFISTRAFNPIPSSTVFDNNNNNSNDNNDNNIQPHTTRLKEQLAREAFRFAEERRMAYSKEGRSSHWMMRGIGYLFEQQSILLGAVLPNETVTSASGGRTVVKIYDLMPYLHRSGDGVGTSYSDSDIISNSDGGRIPTDYDTNYCDRLTVWVRVNGPEIFAGSAEAVPSVSPSPSHPACHWEFPVDLRVSGDYEVDAKVLVWNRKAPFEIAPENRDAHSSKKSGGRCNPIPGGPENVTTDILFGNSENNTDNADDAGNANKELVSGGFIGFKFYYPARSCCEVCTRTPGCIHWATPPKDFPAANRMRNGCELYFDKDGADYDPKYVPSVLASGIMKPPPNRTDGSKQRRRRGAQQKIQILDGLEDTDHDRRRLGNEVTRFHGTPANLPYEVSYFLGCGWSFWLTLDYPCVSGDKDDRVYSNRTSFSFAVNGDDDDDDYHDTIRRRKEEPQNSSILVEVDDKTKALSLNQELPLCTKDDEISENYGGRWARQPWPSDGECDKFQDSLKFDKNRPHCWNRDNLSLIGRRCIEINCKLMRKSSTWFSSVHNETQWYGYWQNNNCNYLQYTTSQLQQCITERKIASIKFTGASISDSAKKHCTPQIEDIVFYDNQTDPDALKVTFSTKKLVHIALNDQSALAEDFQKEPNSTDSDEYYFMSAFYTSSERDALLFPDYVHNVSKLAEGILSEKGWTVLNAFDLSSAFTYDAASQNDGLHITGPPMKMVITKFLHHMCRQTSAKGSIVGQ